MYSRNTFPAAITALSLLAGVCRASAADQVLLHYKPGGAGGEVDLHATLGLPVSGMYPEYTVWCSTNLQSWSALPGTVAGGVGVSDESLRVAVPPAGDFAVYKVAASVKLAAPGQPVGDAIYGYGTEFSRQLQGLGQLPLEQFVARYGLTNSFLSQISFDPTTAEYWDQFSADPAVYNATNPSSPRVHDFRLNTNELAVFQTNGFVVSERLGSYSFADQFYRIFNDDLPVFFSTDAALHAWHKSYAGMLEELEESYLAPTLQSLLLGMKYQVSGLNLNAAGTALRNGVLDADMFLAVANSLASGATDYGSLGQGTRIQTVLNAISNQQPATISLFGANRVVDFSQFQVRGHYTTSQQLGRYFQTMMWCGLADFRFTGSTNDNSLRELSGAVAMSLLMSRSGQFANWQQFDSIVQLFVGVPDSLNFAQLSDLLAAANVRNPSDLPYTSVLQSLQSRLMNGQLGVQNIRSGYFYSPLSRQQIKLPRSFTVMGQRFVPDGWALSKCVFDSIIWDEDGRPGMEDKVLRREPSALDVAFGVLGNDHTVPDIAARILNPGSHPWRDGHPYQHNLAAVRNVMDAQDPSAWTNNMYGHWLACLRELSQPTTGPEFPEAMRTRSWAMKTLNTQLASWTQLKHDTVLYAKQPYTGILLCMYPDGYVEPRTNFWARMRTMALATSNLLSTLPQAGDVVFEPNSPSEPPITVSAASLYTNRMQFLGNFADKMSTLGEISRKELNHQPLTSTETGFLQSLIEDPRYYGGMRTYNGWYPSLYYHNVRVQNSTFMEPSDQADQVVTDVHTDPADPLVGDPGCILHEGVGNVLLLMLAVDSGAGSRAVYAGPVFSHYEFELGPTTRQTDAQWQSQVSAGTLPPQPDWTRSYQVPRP